MNLCRECGEDFGSVSAFDAHRVGVHEYTYREGLKMEPMLEDGRRCMTLEEMRDKFVHNSFGKWSLKDALERARAIGG